MSENVKQVGGQRTWMRRYTSRTRRLVNKKGNMKMKSQPLLAAQNVKMVRPATATAVRIAA
jgi:hypothetical protein